MEEKMERDDMNEKNSDGTLMRRTTSKGTKW